MNSIQNYKFKIANCLRPALLVLIFNFTFFIFNCPAQLTPVQYNASDFTGTTNNLPVTLTSLLKVQVNNQTLLVGLPINFTPVNGTYTTNVYAGLYNLTIQGVPVAATCLVPGSTNLQNLASCVISNLGLFSATNLNTLITNPVTLLPGTNIQMTTNGFTVTINGSVTNINDLTISTNNLPSPLAALSASNGASLTNLIVGQLSSPSLSLPLVWTNIGNQQGLLAELTGSAQTSTGDSAIIVAAPTPSASSSGGFFFPVFGTNPIFNGLLGTPWSVLPNGQTNYYYDLKAGQIGACPANYTASGDINAGTWGLFSNPHWPIVFGGFNNPLGKAADWLFDDFYTNSTIHFPTLPPIGSGGTGDPRTLAFGWDTMSVNEQTATVTVSNLVIKSSNLFAANGNFGIAGVVAVGATNTTSGETLLVEAPGTSFGPSTNYAEIMIKSTTGNDGPSLRFSAHGGHDYGMGSSGSGDGTGAGWFNLYDFNNNQFEFQIDPSGNLVVPNGAFKVAKTLAAASVTSTNAPTFQTTNTAPGGWSAGTGATSPRLWIPFTNGTTVYYLPGY